MGVTIHYSGTLKSPDQIQLLMQEMHELADEAGWEIAPVGPETCYDQNARPLHVEGAYILLHPEMETLSLIFDSKGELINYEFLESQDFFRTNPEAREKIEQSKVYMVDDSGNMVAKNLSEMIDYETMLYGDFTKTQFAGPYAHIMLCKLLKYLSGKYFSVFEVHDDSEYWETGDVEKLIERMNIVNVAIDRFADYLEQRGPGAASEDPDVLLEDLRRFWKETKNTLPHKRKD